jgi:hypothetical protein
MPATKTTTKKTPSSAPAKAPAKLAKLPPAAGAAAKPARKPRDSAKTDAKSAVTKTRERALQPPEPKVAAVDSADTPARWEANKDEWDELRSTRYRRGWQLVALSLGLTPTGGVLKKLPKPQAKHYKVGLKVVRNSASTIRSVNSLQHAEHIIYQGRKNDPSYPLELSYDVVKFVDYFQTLPEPWLDAKLVAAADYWRNRDVAKKGAKPVPKNVDNGRASRIERSLLEIVLGLAIHNYGYIPVGIAGGTHDGKTMRKVYKKISTDLKKQGVSASAFVVSERLGDAVKRLHGDDELRDNVMAGIPKHDEAAMAKG